MTAAALAAGMGVIYLWRDYWQMVWHCEAMLDRWFVWSELGRTIFESILLGPIVNLLPFLAAGAATALVFHKLRPITVGIFLTTGSLILGDWETGWVSGFGLVYRDCSGCPMQYGPIVLSMVVVFAAVASGYVFVTRIRRATT
jgi:hypothetical protein